MKGILTWLVRGCTSRPSTKYIFHHRTLCISLHLSLSPSKLGRQSYRVAGLRHIKRIYAQHSKINCDYVFPEKQEKRMEELRSHRKCVTQKTIQAPGKFHAQGNLRQLFSCGRPPNPLTQPSWLVLLGRASAHLGTVSESGLDIRHKTLDISFSGKNNDASIVIY